MLLCVIVSVALFVYHRKRSIAAADSLKFNSPDSAWGAMEDMYAAIPRDGAVKNQAYVAFASKAGDVYANPLFNKTDYWDRNEIYPTYPTDGDTPSMHYASSLGRRARGGVPVDGGYDDLPQEGRGNGVYHGPDYLRLGDGGNYKSLPTEDGGAYMGLDSKGGYATWSAAGSITGSMADYLAVGGSTGYVHEHPDNPCDDSSRGYNPYADDVSMAPSESNIPVYPMAEVGMGDFPYNGPVDAHATPPKQMSRKEKRRAKKQGKKDKKKSFLSKYVTAEAVMGSKRIYAGQSASLSSPESIHDHFEHDPMQVFSNPLFSPAEDEDDDAVRATYGDLPLGTELDSGTLDRTQHGANALSGGVSV